MTTRGDRASALIAMAVLPLRLRDEPHEGLLGAPERRHDAPAHLRTHGGPRERGPPRRAECRVAPLDGPRAEAPRAPPQPVAQADLQVVDREPRARGAAEP